MKEHVYEWENVVLGATLPAYLFAFHSGFPIVSASSHAPHHFSEEGRDLEEWNMLSFALGLNGQTPFSDNVMGARILDDNILRVTTRRTEKNCKIKYGKLFLFNDSKIFGLPEVIREGKIYEVLDWIDVRSLDSHEVSVFPVTSEDSFLNKVYFCNTGRVDNPRKKDICALSYLHKDQLTDFDYSETMAKIQVERALRECGFKGYIKNKVSPTRKSPSYKPIKLEPAYRDARRIEPHVYTPSKEIKDMQRLTVADVSEMFRNRPSVREEKVCRIPEEVS